MAALRDQLNRASLLFLMCSGYTAMRLHTSPGSLHTLCSMFLSSGFGLYIDAVSDFTSKHQHCFKWASGKTTHPLVLFLLTQTVVKHRVRDLERIQRQRCQIQYWRLVNRYCDKCICVLFCSIGQGGLKSISQIYIFLIYCLYHNKCKYNI